MSLDQALLWGSVAFGVFGGALWLTGKFWPEPKKPKSNSFEQVFRESA